MCYKSCNAFLDTADLYMVEFGEVEAVSQTGEVLSVVIELLLIKIIIHYHICSGVPG